VLRQVEAGAEISDVLTRTADALDVPDLTTVLSLLRQVERYGGEVKEPLLDTLQVIEDRREMELREKVNLISGKMTVVMVLFFFPALLIFVAGPAYVSLMGALGGAVAK
jgi:tight adherence protein C